MIPIIGDTVLQDLTPVRLNLLYGHLLEKGRVKRPGGLARKTVQNVHRMLHRALRDAVKWDLIPRDYAEDAGPPRAHRTSPTIWTPSQLGRFVKSVRDDRFYALWLLVVTAGLRRGELAGLVKGDVDLELGRVSPGQPRVVVDGRAVQSHAKTRSGERSLALDPDTLDAFADHLTGCVPIGDAVLPELPRAGRFVRLASRVTARLMAHCRRCGRAACARC